MIYEFPPSSNPIKQGDIFMNIPRVEFEFSNNVSVLEPDNKTISISWEEIALSKKDVAAILGITSVPAIVATQHCDAQRREYLTLCEIIEITEIKAFENLEKKTLRSIAKDLVKSNRDMPGIFYLPPSKEIGFPNRMVVNFSSTIRLYRKDLEKFITNRKGRLNDAGYEHFREKLSHFFHRYAWTEWYILNKEEILAHGDYSDLKPDQLYEYQK